MILAQTLSAERRAFELDGLPSGWTAFFALLAVVASCYAVVWLYRREGRAGSTGALRAFLGVLRGLVILSLAAVALEPVIAVYRQNTRLGRVAVLYDVSSSMEIREDSDVGRAIPARRESRSPVDVRKPNDMEATARGALPQSLKRARVEAVREVLAGNDHEWLRRLDARNQTSLYAFGDGAAPVELPWKSGPQPIGRPGQATSSPTRGTDSSLPAPARLTARTDIGGAVDQALNDLADGPLAGIIVISDGAVNRGPDAEAIAALAKASKAPIYSVGVGATREPENLRVAQMSGPTTAPLNDPFEITVDVAATGLEAVEATIELRREGDPGAPAAAAAGGSPADETGGPGLLDPARRENASADSRSAPSAEPGELVEAQRLTLTPGAPPTTVKFQVTPKRAGEFRYIAVIPSALEDANAADNAREVAVQVLDEQYRVLLIAGRPSFEYRYLSALLERDKSINVSVWLQSADEQAVREGDTVITELPRRPEDVFAYDAILLLDPYAGDLDSAWAATLRRYVEDFRGGLLIQAGPHFSSRTLRDERLAELVNILPIVPDEEADVRLTEAGTYRTAAAPIQLPEDARAHPLLALHSDPAVSARVWAALGGVYWHLPVARPKPLASTLLVSSSARTRDGGGDVLLAVQPVGSGRAAFMGFDTTWRWRGTAEVYFNRFWIQMVRYLAQGRREQASRRGSITLDRDVVSLGDFAKIEARVLDPQFVPWFEPTVDLTVSVREAVAAGPGAPGAGTGQQQTVLKLTAIPDRPGWFAGRWLFDQPAATTLSLILPGGEPQTIQKVVRIQQPDFEMRSLRQNEEFLRELAARTGGEYMQLADAGSLPERIADATQTSIQRDPQPRSLWDRPWILGTLAALLALEWTLRRRNHLL